MRAGEQAHVQYPRMETAAGALIPETRSYFLDRERYEPPPTVTNRRARKRAASFHRDALLFLNNPMFHTPEAAALRAKIAATDPLTFCSWDRYHELVARIDQLSDYVQARHNDVVEQARQQERRAAAKIAKKQRNAITHQAAETDAKTRREGALQTAIADREREERDRAAREAADKEARRRKAEQRAAERAEKEAERLRQFRERHCKPARQGVAT
jgi:hypothetical protein